MCISWCSFVRVRYYRGGGSYIRLVTGGYKRFGGSYCFYLQFCRKPKDKSLSSWEGLWFQCWRNLTRCLERFNTVPTYRWAGLRHNTRSVCARNSPAEKLTFPFMLCSFVILNWRTVVLANYMIMHWQFSLSWLHYPPRRTVGPNEKPPAICSWPNAILMIKWGTVRWVGMWRVWEKGK